MIGWLPSSPAHVRAWFAINYLGAVFVPLNTAYRGATLAHVVNACRGKLTIAHAALVERLDGPEFEHLERVVAVGPAVGGSGTGTTARGGLAAAPSASAARRWKLAPENALHGDPARLDDSARPQP